MKEVLEVKGDEVELNEGNKKNEVRAADWDILTEGQEKVDWGSVAEVEFRGDEKETVHEGSVYEGKERDEKGNGEKGDEGERMDKVAQLREWIDLGAIARNEDPEGLEAAELEVETRRTRVEQREAELAQNSQRQAEISQRREELPQELAEANVALWDFARKEDQGVFRGLKRALGIGAGKRAELEANLAKLEAEQRDLRQEENEVRDSQRNLEATIAAADIDGPKQEFLEKFETPLSPEEKKEGLDFEALSELSTDEYLRLWRRLNPFFVTHVTRQGIRDHNAMFYHSAGMGEFQDGMTGVLADGKILRTPAEVHYGLGREVTEQSVEESLEKMLFQNKTQAEIEAMREQGMSDKAIVGNLVDGLPVNTTIAAAEPWTDKRAVHFAQMIALDDHYGGESENEAFFVFPTDVIASQCRFGGHMRGNLTTAQIGSETKWNDMFVWPQKKDITIDAGLTFLPKSTMVDAETGSKYATKVVEVDGREVRVPEVDEEGVTKFVEWMKGLKPEDESVKTATSFESKYDMTKLREEGVKAGVPERILDEVLSVVDGFNYNLKKFVEGGELRELWLAPEELEKMSPEERRERSVREFLDGRSVTWKMAENTMPAEEYWEKYFTEHAEQRPAHVIYYDGDPSAAVVSTLEKAGVLEEAVRPYGASYSDEWQRYTGKGDSHERDGDWLGFEENYVEDETTDEVLQEPHQRFNEIARRKVAEHYGLVV